MILHDQDRTVNYEQLCQMIDIWKSLLIDEYRAKPGQSILIDFATPNSYYYSAIWAALELGLILIVDWPNAYAEQDLTAHRMTMYGRINFAIVDSSQIKPNDCNYNYWNLRRTQANCDHIISTSDFKNHQPAHDYSALFLATNDSIATWGASGGTTGAAKLAVNSHKKLLLQSQRHVKIMKYTNTDHALHTRNVMFGAGLIYHFLPTWMTAKQHSVLVYTQVDQLIEFVNQYKISRLFFYTLSGCLEYLDSTSALDHNLRILSIFMIPSTAVELVHKKQIKHLDMIFGDTTIGGTFFLKTVDADTPVSTYEKNCLGRPVDDFFQFRIEDGILWTCIPALPQEWRTSGDRFEIKGDQYYFGGRGNRYKIGKEWVVLGDLDQEVERLFGSGATIVVDAQDEKIYLSIWKTNANAESELHEYFARNFKQVKISQLVRGLDPERFTASRKIDREKLRDYFRHYHLKPILA
jgi:acyl-CoA synthetase (AMP-forming)/AMP-acid ligase II